MKIFNFLRRFGKRLTLEDCIAKMFDTAGITPSRDGSKFHTKVQGKHCPFDVGLDRGDGNKLVVCVPFLLPIDKKLANVANYEVERISKEAFEKFPGTVLHLDANDNGYKLFAITIKPFAKLSADTPDEIRKAMIQTVDILDDKNFESLMAALMGYESYEEIKKNMQMKSVDGPKVSIQLRDGYRELLGKTPDLSNARYLGRLMAYATHIMTKQDNEEFLNRAVVALQNSFDGFIQEIYNVAADGERDLMRKLRYLGAVKNVAAGEEEDFALGRNEAKKYLETSADPWQLLFQENL